MAASSLSEPAWFARLGLPLTEREHGLIAGMLGAFDPGTGAAVAGATSWWDVAQHLRAGARDDRWWDAEEEERERLWTVATELTTEDALLEQMSAVAARWSAVVRAAAAQAAGQGGVADPGLVREAADAALLAAHQHALAVAAGAPDSHYFRCKFALFDAGRWPLGLCAGRYIVF